MSAIELFVAPSRRLYAATPDDQARLRVVPVGQVLIARANVARNPRKHRYWRAFLQFIADNHPELHDADSVNLRLKLAAGFTREFILDGGEVVLVPKSTAYDECGEIEFDEFMRRAKEIAFATLIPDVDRQALEEFLRGETEYRGAR